MCMCGSGCRKRYPSCSAQSEPVWLFIVHFLLKEPLLTPWSQTPCWHSVIFVPVTEPRFRWGMWGQPDCRICFVDMLTACSRGSKGVHAHIFHIQINFQIFGFGNDKNRGKGGVSFYAVCQRAINGSNDGRRFQISGTRRHNRPELQKWPIWCPRQILQLKVASSHSKPFWVKKRVYILGSMAAQSCASVPPDPALMVKIALLLSSGRESILRVSRSSTSCSMAE